MATKKRPQTKKTQKHHAHQLNWKAIALSLLTANIVLAVGVGLYWLAPVLKSPEARALTRFEKVLQDVEAVCQPAELGKALTQLEKEADYNKTGKKMLRAWNEHNCEMLTTGGSDYHKKLNKYLKSRNLPPVEQLDEQQN